MKKALKRTRQAAWISCVLMTAVPLAFAEEGAWKTAYVKRGVVGIFDANWASGVGGTQRMRTPLQFDGSKVRVAVRGANEDTVELVKIALLKGADDQGKITGKPFPILFAGSETLNLEPGLKVAVSDEMPIPVTRGTWYVDDQYAGKKFPYAYDVDSGTSEIGEAIGAEILTKPVTCRTGILTRVDVFTADPRNSILCYGDSITAGYNSTPNADRRYPSVLGKLLDRPVLNLGQNGDVAIYARGIPSAMNDLKGVDTLIFLMGINDIIEGNTADFAAIYAGIVKDIIGYCHNSDKKIYIGTILPAGGNEKFDADPAKEAMRQEINAWIREGNGADGVIDFDAALADPANPKKMRADCQSDWLHPNDEGYRRMAETAAKTLAGK